jgi:hypothetical protein
MAYTLKLSNGTILLSLPDQQSDSVSTSLTLIGKNVNAYGTDLNDNFIKLMENFAGPSIPNSPLNGQLWFDDTAKQLKVYIKTTKDSGYFKSVGSPYIAPSAPNTFAVGDFWFDSTTKQMKFQADSTSTIVVGPSYDSSVGKSGWVNETWQTNAGTTATVLSLYVNNVLVEFVSERAFDVAPSDPRYSTYPQVKSGHTAIFNGTTKTTFIGTATYAENLIDTRYGTSIKVEDILTDSTDTTLYHSLSITGTTLPFLLSLGGNQDFQFSVNTVTNTATMAIFGQDEDFELNVNSTLYPNKLPAIHIDGRNNILGIFTTKPTTSVLISQDPAAAAMGVDVDINGNVLIQGDLVVLGTQTNVKANDLEIVDKNIFLAWTQKTNPPGNVEYYDTVADGGGIVLRGKRDKNILWYNDTEITAGGSKGYWDISDSVNLSYTDSQLSINRVLVLNKDTLYSNYAPNLTQVGNLTSATIANLRISNTGTVNATTIASIPGGGDIIIGAGFDSVTTVRFNNKKLFDVGYPSQQFLTTATYRAQAATVGFVQDQIDIRTNPKYALTIDATGVANTPLDPALNPWVIQNLTYLYDPNDSDLPYRAPNGARARVLITRFQTSATISTSVNNPYAPTSNYVDLGIPVPVDQNGVFSAQQVVGYTNYFTVSSAVPARTLKVNRCIKQYYVTGTYPTATWVEYLPGSAPNNLVWSDGTW